MNSVGVERRLVRPRRRTRPSGLRAVAIVLGICGVFACFFAIGRAGDGVRPGRAEPLSQLPVNASGAAAPIHLGRAPAIEIPVLAPAKPKRPPAPSSATAAPTLPAGAPKAAPLSQRAPVATAPVRAPVPTPSPAPAPRAAPAPSHAPAPSGGAKPRSPSGGSPGTFESSG